MTLDQFIDDVLRVQSILHMAKNDMKMHPERRAGMTIVAEEWYRKLIRRANARQEQWLIENYEMDWRRFRK
jgi:hypothetical protein